ncbi:HAD family phosphatase [Nostoc sp. NMS4]|uniref:HAD family hydrolase n=1 Tax=Nostoc sp. NMS4 TaxID=2815390 RepID=UPI0025FE5C58|nr:HAD family phosphatase [Nostoc sp. NMS4]MBN3922711.1 HAD family phosphatase [Nostoc sp. NMS4]
MLSAILFDLDGTLVNTEPLHYKAWHETLISYGLEIDEEFYKTRMNGGLNSQVIASILPSLSSKEGQKLAEKKETRFHEFALELKPLDGLAKILRWSQKCGLKRAVVTNAPRQNAILTLKVLGLTNAFDTVILAEEAVAGKPDPAPYRLALHRLNISPESAIAFEDSPTGICSSVGAGIYTIGIASSQNPDCLCKAGAKIAIPDFNAEPLWELLNSSSRVTSDIWI